VDAANDFTELLVWTLADELRIEMLKFTSREPLSKDWKFRAQIVDALDSICRNVAEGFAADTHGGFAWYLRVSLRSLNELRDALRSMLLKRYDSSGAGPRIRPRPRTTPRPGQLHRLSRANAPLPAETTWRRHEDPSGNE
jgi:four helix bundle protein